MTREEAIAIIRREYLCVDRDCDIEKNCGRCDLMMPRKEPLLEAYKMVMDALEQEPCDDCISRQAVNNLQKYRYNCGDTSITCISLKSVNELPPVKPQYTDDEIQKIQDLEQAEIQKAYELGKAKEPREVLYSGDGYADGEMVYDMAECPNCGREFEDDDETWNCNFCPDCGQALDWGLDNEEED